MKHSASLSRSTIAARVIKACQIKRMTAREVGIACLVPTVTADRVLEDLFIEGMVERKVRRQARTPGGRAFEYWLVPDFGGCVGRDEPQAQAVPVRRVLRGSVVFGEVR